MNIDDAVAIITTDAAFLSSMDALVDKYESKEESDEPTDLEVAVMLKMGWMLHERLAVLLAHEPSIEELSKLSNFLQVMYESGKLPARESH